MTRWPSRVWILGGGRDYSLLQNLKIGSGSHPTFCSVGATGSFLGVKQPGCEADTNLHIMMRVRISDDMLPLHLYDFMTCTGTYLPFCMKEWWLCLFFCCQIIIRMTVMGYAAQSASWSSLYPTSKKQNYWIQCNTAILPKDYITYKWQCSADNWKTRKASHYCYT